MLGGLTINRIIDLSEEPAHLKVHLDNLVIKQNENEETRIPLDEVAVVVTSHPQITYTHAVLARLASVNAVLVVCDDKRLPSAVQLSLTAHHIQTERLALQISVKLPLKKRLWQQIVQAKIKAQANLLQRIRNTDGGLKALVPLVKSGDTTNIEARASRIYWQLLFEDPDFRRERFAEDQNRLLNYGYAVLRAIVARAICASGLHPSIGIHHHNRYDPFCLAADLMEPFRPLVDDAVVNIVNSYGPDAPLNKQTKTPILEKLYERYPFQGEKRNLFDITTRCVNSLLDCFTGEKKKLLFPEL